jgi:hypothetical protein
MITTALWQKTFVLKQSTVVDLHTLKKLECGNISELSQKAKVDSPFYICFMPTSKKSEYYGMVVIKPGKDKIEVLQTEDDIVSMKNNNITFSVSVYVND